MFNLSYGLKDLYVKSRINLIFTIESNVYFGLYD